jgi:hypothetical protein
MPQEGVPEPLATDGQVLELKLDTYAPSNPGNQFLGTDLLTQRNFARAGGLTFEARMRLKPTIVGGLVNGFFTFDVTRNVANPLPPPATIPVRDEIDFELLSNQATGAATQDPFTNFWNDQGFAHPGSGQFINVAGFDLTQFQNYKVEWTPSAIKWYVNNQLVRTQTTNVPDDPMKLHFNLWAPDSSFADAFNAALNPAATPGANQTYTVQVDHVEVNRLNTTAGTNLLANPSFEADDADGKPSFIVSGNTTVTGEWLGFGGNPGPPNQLHVSYELDDFSGTEPGVPDVAHDGIFMLKAFGPFNGPPDASGIVQNVPAVAGEQFEASAWFQAPSGDTIIGTQNFNTISLSFHDINGVQIGTGSETHVLDGADPNIVADTWVKGVVNGLAPAGTAFARVNLFFIQLQNQGGASWFDDVSLVKLTPNFVALEGDFNMDGVVDAADYVMWRKTGLPSDGYTLWRTNFGASQGGGGVAGSVPEPCSCLAVALFALFAGIGFRRRAVR